MVNLKAFHKAVDNYCDQAFIPDRGSRQLRKATQADLAVQSGMSAADLSRKLNGHVKFQEQDVRNIVRTFADWEVIKNRGQARYLLRLMEITDFNPWDWKVDPLKKLEDDGDDSGGVKETNEEELSIQQALFPYEYEMRPQRPPIFIGRADELYEFRTALKALIHPELVMQSRRVFLLDGQGGWGKSTLLSRYVDICDEEKEHIFWIYIDWERADIEAYRSTSMMMDHLAGQFENKYRDELIHFQNFRTFQKAVAEQRGQVATTVDTLSSQFKGQMQNEVEFERFLSNRLSLRELDIFRPQLKLSKAFVSDLLEIVKVRPVVFLFDTWEVVRQYADQWLRTGLLQHCLTHRDLGHRFLFVIAGRWMSEEDRAIYFDDIRRYTHARGVYYRALDKFTPGDIQQYFQGHPKIKQSISDEAAIKVREITLGIPLAVEIVGSMAEPEKNITQFLAELEEPDSEHKADVINQMVTRFFRHLQKQPESKVKEDLDCIYSFALMRRSEGDFARRETLLQEVWRKTMLIHNEDEFWQRLQELRNQYSFLFKGAYMHADVYTFIRTVLMRDYEQRVKLCKPAAESCKAYLGRRTGQIEAEVGAIAVGEEKLKDDQWQEWFLDWISYRLWHGDDIIYVIKDIVKHYFLGLEIGTRNFHLRLVSMIRDDRVLYDQLPAKARLVIDQLATLPEWFGLTERDAERQSLLTMLEGATRILGLIKAAESAIQKGDFTAANKNLNEAENLYQTLGSEEKSQQIRIRMADAYYQLGKKMLLPLQRGSVRLERLRVLEKACRWNPENPYIHCSLAEVLMSLHRFAEAEMEINSALLLSREEKHQAAKDWSQKLRDRWKKEIVGPYSHSKHAKISMSRALSLSAQGDFQRAEA